jgi:hypothetical protein
MQSTATIQSVDLSQVIQGIYTTSDRAYLFGNVKDEQVRRVMRRLLREARNAAFQTKSSFSVDPSAWTFQDRRQRCAWGLDR